MSGKKIFLTLLILFTILGVVFSQAQQQTAPKKEATGEPEIGKPAEKILIDFSALPEDLQIDKWRIKLSGYSDIPKCRNLSDLKIVNVDSAKLPEDVIKFNSALGIRVNFEFSHGNDWAQVYPFYGISEFYAKEGNGILRNVGPIKSVSILVSGRNYDYAIEVRMVDQDGKFKSINFGSLWFKGWKKLTWENPDFIKELKKRDLNKTHLYPQYEPYLKFDSIVIYKSPREYGGDFVTYVKDIRVEYEPAVVKYEFDINDENEWKIMETNAQQKKELLRKRLDLYFSGSSMEEEFKKDIQIKEKSNNK